MTIRSTKAVVVLTLASACGGAPFVYAPAYIWDPDSGTWLEADASNATADASDGGMNSRSDSGGDNDVSLKLPREASTDARQTVYPDANDAALADAAADSANDSAVADSSADASNVDAAPKICCRLTTSGSTLACSGDWECCSGSIVGCDGGVCTGTCAGRSATCGAPMCNVGQSCFEQAPGGNLAGVVEVCP